MKCRDCHEVVPTSRNDDVICHSQDVSHSLNMTKWLVILRLQPKNLLTPNPLQRLSTNSPSAREGGNTKRYSLTLNMTDSCHSEASAKESFIEWQR